MVPAQHGLSHRKFGVELDPVCRSDAAQVAGVYVRRCGVPRIGHWREYRDFHAGQAVLSGDAAGEESRADCSHHKLGYPQAGGEFVQLSTVSGNGGGKHALGRAYLHLANASLSGGWRRACRRVDLYSIGIGKLLPIARRATTSGPPAHP